MFDNIGNSLKGMLYNDVQQTKAPTKDEVAKATSAGVSTITGSSAPSAPQAGLNQAYVDAIKQVTYGRNTAFTQLIQASKVLEDVIPDPIMRLKAAYKTAGAGRSASQIADAVTLHLSDVDGEERKFQQAIDQKNATEIASIELKAATANASIQSSQAEIQSLQQRIADLTAGLQDLSNTAQTAAIDVQNKRNGLEIAKSEFKVAAQAVRNELNNSKAAITATLV
jgi:predicted ribosome quality control (RQC) complex YloA/Tae2 family protein